jgi:hypothetical protein
MIETTRPQLCFPIVCFRCDKGFVVSPSVVGRDQSKRSVVRCTHCGAANDGYTGAASLPPCEVRMGCTVKAYLSDAAA